MKKIIPKEANLIPQNAKRVFKGEIFEVYQWPQEMFDGSIETFEMLKRPDTVVVIAIKDDKIIILKQSQPNIPQPFLSFPGGRSESGETALEAAKREMLEETGMSFKNWRLLSVAQPEGKVEWFIYSFLAADFEGQTGTKHDSGEKIEIMEKTFQEVLDDPNRRGNHEENTLAGCKTLEELKVAPEFSGREIESA